MDLRRQIRNEPLFILGPARSGTSLLYKVLCLHPSVFYLSNWTARFPKLPWLSALNRVAPALPRFRDRVWFGLNGDNAYVYGKKRTLRERLFPMPVEGEPVFRGSGIAEDGHSFVAGPEAIRLLRRRIAVVGRFAGGAHFVNKRIANNRRIGLLREAFPDARFLAIVRDGRAVAHSLSRVDWWQSERVWWYGGTPEQWEADGGEPWALCARNWVEDVKAMDAGLEAVPGSRKLLVKYEDLVASPAETFLRIADFAQFTSDDEWFAHLARLRFRNRREAWRDELLPEEIAIITHEQQPLLRQYGYAL